MPKYIFFAGVVTIRVCGHEQRFELWRGLETGVAVNLADFARAHGYDLIPADGLTVDELRSAGVDGFAPFPSFLDS